VWGGACPVLGGVQRPSRPENCGTCVCSESGLPDDPLWGRLGYIRWLDSAQDLYHSKVTHPINNTDFTGYGSSAGVVRICISGRNRIRIHADAAYLITDNFLDSDPDTAICLRNRIIM